MQPHVRHKALCALTAIASVAFQPADSMAAELCPDQQVPPLNCPDGHLRQLGNILVTGYLGSGQVGVLSVDSAAAVANVFVHSSWSGHDIGNVHSVPHSPKEQYVLTGVQGSYSIHRLDECGQSVEQGVGGLVLQGQYRGFTVDSVTGDLIVSSSIERRNTHQPPQPARHEYFRIAPDGSGFTTLTSELDSVVYEGADTRVSGAMTYDSAGTLWQSGYGQESLTSITQEQLSQSVPRESLHRVGAGLGLNALAYDGRYLWGSPALGDAGVYRISPEGPDYVRTLWYTADFETSNSNGNDTRGVTVDADGNPWVVTFDSKLVQLSKDSPNTVLKVVDLRAAVPEFSSPFALGVYGANPEGITRQCDGLACAVGTVGGAGRPWGTVALGLGLALAGLTCRRRHSSASDPS